MGLTIWRTLDNAWMGTDILEHAFGKRTAVRGVPENVEDKLNQVTNFLFAGDQNNFKSSNGTKHAHCFDCNKRTSPFLLSNRASHIIHMHSLVVTSKKAERRMVPRLSLCRLDGALSMYRCGNKLIFYAMLARCIL